MRRPKIEELSVLLVQILLIGGLVCAPIVVQRTTAEVRGGSLHSGNVRHVSFMAAKIPRNGYSTPLVPAHDWYPRECCMDMDCASLDNGEVSPTSHGWYIHRSRETITFSDRRLRLSPDGKFHRCVEEFWDLSSKTRCLFVPNNQSS